MASVQIFGIKTGFNVIGFIRGRIQAVISAYFNFIRFVVTTIAKIVTGAPNSFPLKMIFRLPVINVFVKIFGKIRHLSLSVITMNFESLSKFVENIVKQHKDFFAPLFQKILNFVLAVTGAIKQIKDGGHSTGKVLQTFIKISFSFIKMFSKM